MVNVTHSQPEDKVAHSQGNRVKADAWIGQELHSPHGTQPHRVHHSPMFHQPMRREHRPREPSDGFDQAHVPRAEMREQLGRCHPRQCTDERRRSPDLPCAQQGIRAAACQPDVCDEQHIESDCQRKDEKEGVRKIKQPRKRIGRERRAAHDRRTP
jgi:hypothetical protein